MNYLHFKDKAKICFFVALLVVAIIAYAKFFSIYSDIKFFLISQGSFGPLIYILIIMLIVLISPVPSAILVIAAGNIFTPMSAAFYTLIGALLGSVIAISISRFLLRDYIERKFSKKRIFRMIEMIEEKNENTIAFFIFLLKLIPQFSLDFISYIAGLTRIKIWKYALAVLLGMTPMVLILTLFSYKIYSYNLIILIIIFIFVIYSIYKTIKSRRYYVKGY